MHATGLTEVTTDAAQPIFRGVSIAAIISKLKRVKLMSTPQQQTTGGWKIDIPTVVAVLGLCGGTAGGILNYVGGMKEQIRDNATQVAYMKEDIKRIDNNQVTAQRDVRDDLRRIEDKLDRAINANVDTNSVRRWTDRK